MIKQYNSERISGRVSSMPWGAEVSGLELRGRWRSVVRSKLLFQWASVSQIKDSEGQDLTEIPALPSTLHRWKGDGGRGMLGGAESYSRGTSHPQRELAAPEQGAGWLREDEGKHEDKADPPSELPPSPATSGYLSCWNKLLETSTPPSPLVRE